MQKITHNSKFKVFLKYVYFDIYKQDQTKPSFSKRNVRHIEIFKSYLQLLYREVKGILLNQGFPRPIFSTSREQRGMFFRQNWSRESVVKYNIFNFPKK